MKELLELTDNGLYCPAADVYIDPWHPVRYALITHGHADHSRPGHQKYLCTHTAKPVMRYRLGRHSHIESVGFGETVRIKGVAFSFHPAGHIPGSAQIRVEHKGEIWVVSGDYKLEADGVCEAFEPVNCHTFITESTFGLPVYRWEPQSVIFDQINQWWRANQREGLVSVLGAYALGKAQRLLRYLDPEIGAIYTHGAIENVTAVLRAQKLRLPSTIRILPTHKKKDFEGSLVLATPGAMNSSWAKRLGPHATGLASGWMQLRGARRRRAADRGFVISDHADWPGLLEAVKATGATRVLATHGYSDLFSRWLSENGWDAKPLDTQFVGESLEDESS